MHAGGIDKSRESHAVNVLGFAQTSSLTPRPLELRAAVKTRPDDTHGRPDEPRTKRRSGNASTRACKERLPFADLLGHDAH